MCKPKELREQIAEAIKYEVGESPCWTNFCCAADRILQILEDGPFMEKYNKGYADGEQSSDDFWRENID